MVAYSTPASAVAQGAKDDPALEGVLEQVGRRIDAFTGTFFDRRTETRTLEVDPEVGVAFLPAEATVTAVRHVGTDTVLPETAWRVVGTRLYLPGKAGADVLVAGAEPYRGGYASLLGRGPWLLEVTGTWGPAEVPADVALASDLLAASLLPAPFVPTTDAEGNPQGVADAGETVQGEDVRPATRSERTTGLAEADRLLAPWRSAHATAYRMA